MSAEQADMFGGGHKREEALREPKEITASVVVDPRNRDAVRIQSEAGDLHWIARSLIRFNGLGQQQLLIETWKAKELSL
tara:strand:- start:1869 stop:2105 length:237 start_codon:yes stop_codon:yes gene_type:complete